LVVDRDITTHYEWAGWNPDKSEEVVIGKIPGVGAEAGESRRELRRFDARAVFCWLTTKRPCYQVKD
jgi:hypothetical protein